MGEPADQGTENGLGVELRAASIALFIKEECTLRTCLVLGKTEKQDTFALFFNNKY